MHGRGPEQQPWRADEKLLRCTKRLCFRREPWWKPRRIPALFVIPAGAVRTSPIPALSPRVGARRWGTLPAALGSALPPAGFSSGTDDGKPWRRSAEKSKDLEVLREPPQARRVWAGARGSVAIGNAVRERGLSYGFEAAGHKPVCGVNPPSATSVGSQCDAPTSAPPYQDTHLWLGTGYPVGSAQRAPQPCLPPSSAASDPGRRSRPTHAAWRSGAGPRAGCRAPRSPG